MQSTFVIKISSLSQSDLRDFLTYLLNYLQMVEITYSLIKMPTYQKTIVLLRSPHVHKRSKEKFCASIFKASIYIYNSDLLKLSMIMQNIPSNVHIRIIKKDEF